MKNRYMLLSLTILLFGVFYASSYAGNTPIAKGNFLLFGGFSAVGAEDRGFVGYTHNKGNLLEFSNTIIGDMPSSFAVNRVTTLELNPSLNYCIISGLSFGINLLASRASVENYSDTRWGLGPQVMYFFGRKNDSTTVKKKMYPFIRGAFTYVRKKTSSEYLEIIDEQITPEQRFHTGFGFMYIIAHSVGLFGEASFEFDRHKTTFSISDGHSMTTDPINGNKFNIIFGLAGFF